jgi:predicted amidohydrolase YtcJ
MGQVEPKDGAARVALCACFLILFASLSLAQTHGSIAPADTVVIHAQIYTVNEKQPRAEALAIRGEKIVAVGSEKEIAAYRGRSTKVIDAGQRMVLPGFTDCHIHFLDGSLSLTHVNVEGLRTVAEIQAKVKEYAAAHPDEAWVLGRGWSYPVFGETALPDKTYLDGILPDRPVYLEGFDGHTWWANSKALQLAGITKETKDPPGGSFVRDPKTGEPTGAVKEDAADAMMRKVIPAPTREEKLAALRAGLREANRVGLVRGHSAGGVTALLVDQNNIDLYDELRKSGELTVRMYIAYRLDPPMVTDAQLRQIAELKSRYHDEWISAGAAKFFIDGVIETHTAAMLTPYSDDPAISGNLLWDEGVYRKAVAALDKQGVQIFTHAIGDRAVRFVLDTYQETQKENGTVDARHRIEHIETISAADIPKFGELGVIASFQPLHAYPDEDTLKVWARNTGPERATRAWAWRSIETAGGHVGFGSDWPIVTLNPWPGLQNAVTRQTTEGEPVGGFVPKERMSVADAIRGYTIGAAYAGKQEKSEGSLEPGKLADLIVLSQDLFKIEPSDIGKTEVLLTMVGGKVVYRAASWGEKATTPVN